MTRSVNKLLRFRLLTLCGACAIWATIGPAANAGPPGHGNRGLRNQLNSLNRIGRPYGGFGYSGVGADFGVGPAGLFGFDLTGNDNEIPYFAAHPPVYYSYPIARPYGDSPYPYPPGWYVPAATDGGPQMIINPYAQPGNEPSNAAPSNAAPSKSAPSHAAPAPTGPTSSSPNDPAPKSVKPAAGRTASLVEPVSPSVESLPSPEPVAIGFISPAASRVHVVVNPYAK